MVMNLESTPSWMVICTVNLFAAYAAVILVVVYFMAKSSTSAGAVNVTSTCVRIASTMAVLMVTRVNPTSLIPQHPSVQKDTPW